MKLTVFGLSPEITRNETPRFWRNSTVSRTFSRREFLSVTIAIGRNFSLSNNVSISPDLLNSASKSTRKPFPASSSTCFEICLASFRSSKFFKINSGAPNTTERTEFWASKVSPLNFRLEEKAIAFNTLKFRFFENFFRPNSAKIARAVAFFSLLCELISTKIFATFSGFSPFKTSKFSKIISGEVSVPVLSVARISSKAISSIAEIFCGRTFAWSNRSEPYAKNREVARSKPSGTTTTAAEVIVLRIVTCECSKKV